MQIDLNHAASLLAGTLGDAIQGQLVVGADRRILAFNPAFETQFSPALNPLKTGANYDAALDAWAAASPQPAGTLEGLKQGQTTTAPFELEISLLHLGKPRWLLMHHQPMPGQSFVRTFIDVTAYKLTGAELQEREKRFLALSTMSSDWFWLQDANYRFTQFSGAFAFDFTPPANTVGKTRWELNIQLTPDQWAEHRAVLDARQPFRNFEYAITDDNGETRWYSINGEPLFDEHQIFVGYHGTGRNISDRKTIETEVAYIAYHDSLTGLANRLLLLDRMKQQLATCTRNGGHGALFLLDLDNFKTLNDTQGHDKGDLLLQQVAQRLLACVREIDTVARLGGDEFVVMLNGLSEHRNVAAAQAGNVGAKILEMLTQPYQLEQHSVRSTPSIGVTLFGSADNVEQELLKQADLAMYQAKASGRNTLRFFNPAMEAHVKASAALEVDLRDAVQQEQFILHYQAQVHGQSRVTGAEALVRWIHPQRGIVSPADFIPLAEDTGLILPLGLWVLKAACLQLSDWAKRPEACHLTLSVNISALQLKQLDFVEQVLALLNQTGANPGRLKLELTESLLVSDVDTTISKMKELQANGVGFSLDDFGTGFSSLSNLKRLPLDQLKIDQSFVRDILVDPDDAAIAKMVIALADSLGLMVIAEGVEQEAQRVFLADQGCHAYQGYLFSRPLALREFEALLLPSRGHVNGP